MRLSVIAAVDRNHLIGLNGKLPWHIPDDLKNFRQLTMGKPVIMGRKTYASIGKPLAGRINIVLSSGNSGTQTNCATANSLEAAIGLAEYIQADECFVIGGARVYDQVIDRCDRLYLTRIDHAFEVYQEADVAYFPAISKWLSRPHRIIEQTMHPKGANNPYPWVFEVVDFQKS